MSEKEIIEVKCFLSKETYRDLVNFSSRYVNSNEELDLNIPIRILLDFYKMSINSQVLAHVIELKEMISNIPVSEKNDETVINLIGGHKEVLR